MNDGFKFDPANMPKIDFSTTNHLANSVADSIAANQRETERVLQSVQRERERKEANEEAYRQESLRVLKSIEQSKNANSGVYMTNKQRDKMNDYISRLSTALSNHESEDLWQLFSTLNAVYGNIITQIQDLYSEAAGSGGLLERNLGVVSELLENYIIDNEVENNIVSNNETVGEPIIFLSHRGTDWKYGHALRDFLVGLGLKKEQLIYTSHELHKIPGGLSIFEYLRANIRRDVFMLILWSEDYLNSIPCLCEMGACWVTKCEYWHIFTPYFDFKSPKLNECPLDMQKVGAALNGDSMCKANMMELKNKVQEMFGLVNDEATSTYVLDTFIKKIKESVAHE